MTLDQLAERINKKWPECPVRVEGDSMWFLALPMRYMSDLSDIYNPHFIVWALDRLRELKRAPSLHDFKPGDPGGAFGVSLATTAATFQVWRSFEGKTRAEAVARALYAALEEK